jgi:hypothetical protein
MENIKRDIPYEFWGVDAAITFFDSVVIERDNPKDPLNNTDIENGIAQAIWKLFDDNRSAAAKHLDINELDVYLANVIVVGVKIDGHMVINPHGFTGKTIEFIMCLTLIPKGSEHAGKYIFEEGVLQAYVLGVEKKEDVFVYIRAGQDRTSVYIRSGSSIRNIDTFGWGADTVLQAFKDVSFLPHETSALIYQEYVSDNVSEPLRRKLSGIFKTVFERCIKHIAATLKGHRKEGQHIKRTTSFYLTSFPLPKEVYAGKYDINGKNVAFIRAEEGDISLFMETIQKGPYEEMNAFAYRRVKWLMNA